jgi:hypothetical protein
MTTTRNHERGGFALRTGWALLAALALLAWAPRVHAFPMYDDGSGNGCVSCHNGYTNEGSLHLAHLTKFGINACGLCHMNPNGGDTPVYTYKSNVGFGCAGCHGHDYGETSIHSGLPKATAYGLRRKHALIFAAASQPNLCATCHFPGSAITGDPDPAPAIYDETVRPPYYNQPTYDNLTDPCSSAQESFDNTEGLDNDGNGFADMADSACQAFMGTTTTTTVFVTTTTSTSTSTTFPPNAPRHIRVYPGQSIQDAVDAVAPRGTVYVMPGTYVETHGTGTDAVTVGKGIRLIARSKPKAGLKVILQAAPGQHNGFVVQPPDGNTTIEGFQIKGFTIQGFQNNGIITRHLDKFRIENNESIDNLENGIWPTLSANGLVKKNVSYGSEDSALWVEASENVRVIGNELHHSPTGLEITVSNNITAMRNDVHDNVTGVGLYNFRGAGLPPLSPPELNSHWNIVNNNIHDNNLPNTVTSGLVAQLPSGGGVLVAGVDDVNIVHNTITNNDFYGISVVDWCFVVGCPTIPPGNPPTLDGAPDGNTYISNTLSHNGTNPQPGSDPLLQAFAVFAADITFVVPDSNPPVHANCFSGNTYSTRTSVFNPVIPQSKSCP